MTHPGGDVPERTEQTVDVAGVPTRVTRGGAGAPVLLLHGGFGSVDEWDSSLARLADAYDVIAYDRRGHGGTPDVGDWDRRMLASDASALLDALGIASAHVVGYSDGAVVAADLAAAQPERIRSLALLCTALRPDDWVVLPPEPDPRDPLAMLPAEIVDAYRRHSPDGDERLAHVLERSFAFSREDHGVDLLADLDAPALVLSSDDDIATLESSIALYRTLRRGELAIVPHASHDAPREHPDLLTSLVRDFLRGERAATHIPIRRG